MAQPYQHKRLESPDSIRLLDLLPARDRNAPVKCRIRQRTMKKARKKYEALSYVWGATEGDRPIICDGDELLVTANCYDAIIHLRRRLLVRTLWIDSICIDQRKAPDSIQERNHQVKQMGKLYHNASRVVVWLGPNTTGLTAIFNSFVKFMMYTMKHRRFVEVANRVWWKAFLTRLDPKQHFFVPLLHSPWFMRMWTVQEFAFATECILMWGPQRLKWNQIHRLISLGLITSKEPAQESITFRDLAARLVDSKSKAIGRDALQPSNELRFLLSLRNQQSTLDHDKIYGVYAILDKMGIEMPEPDYNKPIESVIEDFTWAYISFRKRLDPITSELPRHGSPSWVPNYISPLIKLDTILSVDNLGRLDKDLDYPLRAASGRSKAYIADSRLPAKLVVKGKRVDFLESKYSCSSEYPPGIFNTEEMEHFREYVQVCQQWCQVCAEMLQSPEETIYKTSRLLMDAVAQAIVMNYLMYIKDSFRHWFDLMLYPGCSELSPAEIRDSAQLYNPARLENQPLPSDIIIDYLLSKEIYDDDDLRLIQTVANRFANWAFLVTRNGYLGRAYRTCQEGDQLWLLAGSANPVVLRQSGAEYIYIAPACFGGMMDGELWPENEEELELLTLV